VEVFPELKLSELTEDKRIEKRLAKLKQNGTLDSMWKILYKQFMEEISSLPQNSLNQEIKKNIENGIEMKEPLGHLKESLLRIMENMMDQAIKSIDTSNISPSGINKGLNSSFTKNESSKTETKFKAQKQRDENKDVMTNGKISQENLTNYRLKYNSVIKDRRSIRASNSEQRGLLNLKQPVQIHQELYERLTTRNRKRYIDQNESQDNSLHLPSINDSRTSSRSRQRSQHSRIHSEFNYIKGPASFMQSQRKVFVGLNHSPGPANYLINASFTSLTKKAPTPFIGKASRKTWIEEASLSDSPGPANLYPSKHLVLK